ncbi:substrate-binding and VWA domain-containing protein, partial [Streptomyces sp. NPDC059900]
MGRHSLPDEDGADAPGPRPRSRGRTVAIATALVLTVAAGTAVAVRSDLLSFGGSCRDHAVQLDVAAAPDIAPALQAAADDAREKEVTSDGSCIDVRVTARDSYKVADELRTGKGDPRYEVWVPDSELWLQRVGLGSKQNRVTPAGNIASSPVGMAMVPSAAESLGWPKKTYSWPELTGAAMKDDKLRLGAADPARSATGLLALAKLSTSARKSGGKGGDTQAAGMAKALSSRTSDSDSQLVDTLARDASGTEQGNPRRNQALILSEQAAFAHNASAGEENSLDMFYPEDGSPRLDYPYTLVQEDELSTDQSRAALRFMTLFSDDEGRALLEEHGFRTGAEDPSAKLVTAAGGRTPQPYAAEASEPPTEKELQETLGMWTITVQSARLSTVVDVSDSMGEFVPGQNRSRMEVTKSSLLQALAGFTDQDEIGLWEFAT